jgi:hypothetical protein
MIAVVTTPEEVDVLCVEGVTQLDHAANAASGAFGWRAQHERFREDGSERPPDAFWNGTCPSQGANGTPVAFALSIDFCGHTSG